ncbi:hypothetical protein B0J14DRAFT_319621 [Halenospora varia]|nr:hypothetical protein B0J14DRAFT_319621 [Halenospora varia]
MVESGDAVLGEGECCESSIKFHFSPRSCPSTSVFKRRYIAVYAALHEPSTHGCTPSSVSSPVPFHCPSLDGCGVIVRHSSHLFHSRLQCSSPWCRMLITEAVCTCTCLPNEDLVSSHLAQPATSWIRVLFLGPSFSVRGPKGSFDLSDRRGQRHRTTEKMHDTGASRPLSTLGRINEPLKREGLDSRPRAANREGARYQTPSSVSFLKQSNNKRWREEGLAKGS